METMKNPREVLDRWMSYVNGASVEGLLSLYNPGAILIPTFSNRILDTPEKIKKYFEVLGSREELSIALHEKTLLVQPHHEELYSLFGIYCWRFAVDGELLSFEARFSYFVDMKEASPIFHHHSSQIPRVL